jgi:hypothetical protein
MKGKVGPSGYAIPCAPIRSESPLKNGIEIEFVRSKKSFRKEDRVKAVLEKRGEHPAVVCILSAMEPCGSYQPWYDKKSHETVVSVAGVTWDMGWFSPFAAVLAVVTFITPFAETGKQNLHRLRSLRLDLRAGAALRSHV